ncbi:MAG: phage tail sheath subtilisin-like domain-containing protein [Alphaproteobacteria bacterium]|nr:phage tail sheath subtilisin-like domain-containing protein [Alphaproteobacteria bacterium]
MISFDQIPIDLRVPGAYLEYNNTAANRGLPGMPSRILVIGQRLAAGTQAAGAAVKVLDVAQAEALFGRGSMLHLMFRALKAANTWTESWAIALDDDGAANAAGGSVLFGGAVTGAGTVNLYIAGQRVRIGVASTDTPAAVATAAAAAINATTDLPVTAAVNGVTAEQVDITARNKGEAGNATDIRVNYNFGEVLPAGLTAAITAMSAGAANPDIATAIAAFGDTWYTDIAMPYTDAANLAALEGELENRAGPTVMMDGHAYAAATGTHATLTTLGNSRNSEHLSIMAASDSPSAPWAWSAALTGVAAYHTRIDPARPLQTLVLDSILPPVPGDRFTLEERNLLLFDGIATFKVDDGGRVLIERVITTYETNASGIDDPSYLDLTTMKTLAYLRYSVRARILQKYPRHKLASDGTAYGAGQAIVTPSVIRAELIALFKDWESAGLVEGIDQFKADLIVERDASDVNRVNALIPPDVVNQFRVFAGQVQFRL